MCYSMSSIMLVIELIKRKNESNELLKPSGNEYRLIVSLLLYLTKLLYLTEKVIIADLVFCPP